MSQVPRYEYPVSNSNQDSTGDYFDKYVSLMMDAIQLFDTYNRIYKQELEQLSDIEEQEIKEGMDEIASGKYMHFDSTEEYLKYLNESN